jgi:hypothetical protein
MSSAIKSSFLFLGYLLLSGCSTTGLEYRLKVEGEPHVVKQLKGNSNSYVAHEESTLGGWIDPNDYRRNILAIEAATGCIVDKTTIINEGLQTTALVICDK